MTLKDILEPVSQAATILRQQPSREDRADAERIMTLVQRLVACDQTRQSDSVMDERQASSVAQPLSGRAYTCAGLLESVSQLFSKFEIGLTPGTPEFADRIALGRLLLGVFHRHDIAEIEFRDINGAATPFRLITWKARQDARSLAEAFRHARRSRHTLTTR